MKLFITTLTAINILVSFQTNVAFAQDREVSVGIDIPDSLDFHGYLGVAAGAFPDYEGSENYEAIALPFVEIQQPDFLFLKGGSVNPNDGFGSLGWNALKIKYSVDGEQKAGLSLGPIIRFNHGRDENDNSRLNGLGDIDDSIGLGGFMEAKAGNWLAKINAISQDTGVTGDGFLVDFRSSYTAQISDRFSITPEVYTSWGDDEYTQGFYGVNTAQAERSRFNRFDAKSGFKNMGIALGTNYALSESILISGQIGYQRLLGDIADSPISDSNDQYRALLGVAYKF